MRTAVLPTAALAVALLLLLLAWRQARKTRNSRPTAAPDPLAGRCEALEAELRSHGERLDLLAARLGGLDADARSRAEELAALGARMDAAVTVIEEAESKLIQELAAGKTREALLQGLAADVRAWRSTPPPAVSVDLERKILDETWKLTPENLTAPLESARQDEGWQEVQGVLLVELPKLVPEELRTSLQAVLAPARDYYNLTAKLTLVPKLLAGEMPSLAEAQEIRRLRELSQLLVMVQSSNLVADRLCFRLRTWIADHFLGFADLLLQRHQQAQLAGRVEAIEPAVGIARRVLGLADLLPIELTLGRTPFDSTRHIGRSTTRDPNFSDGVILGVVRNGFLRGGREVIRQPEVIVNRVR